MRHTLGLDLGPSSIGWALISDSGITACGVRVFPEGVDNFDTQKEQSRSSKRRQARGMRRQHRRTVERLHRVRDALTHAGLYPADADERQALEQTDPYPLRARGVEPNAEALTPHEIGRAILHLSQRRGFLSNAKKPKDQETEGLLGEINRLSDHVATAADDKKPTLGQFLAQRNAAFAAGRETGDDFQHGHRDPDGADRVRRRHTSRRMIEAEFNRLWDNQARHHPDLLTDKLRDGERGRPEGHPYPMEPVPRVNDQSQVETFGLHGLLFFHRKLRWPKSMIGRCELAASKRRCPRSDRTAQAFRIWHDVNNLRYLDPDDNLEKSLDDDQRKQVAEKLFGTRQLTFNQLRSHLGFAESVRFKQETGGRSKLPGHVTDALLSASRAYGSGWRTLAEDTKNDVVEILIDPARDDEEAEDRLIEEHGLTPEQADAVLRVDLPAGYVSYARETMTDILPHLQKGHPLRREDRANSAVHLAGYTPPDEREPETFDLLPDGDRLTPGRRPLPDIPNPVVRRTLAELKKVVNAIVREHGRPDQIHVELTRQLRLGEKKRRELSVRMNERASERDAAADRLREHGVRVSRASILKYRLWEEQRLACAYCGQSLTVQDVFSQDGGVEIDHILPWSRTLDDSQLNKVVCCSRCNRDKGQRTPLEWLGEGEPFDAMLQRLGSWVRTGSFPYPKLRKCSAKKVDTDDFIARQLTDTGYLSRMAVRYLNCLYTPAERRRNPVQGRKGQLTAELRHQWGLDRVLSDLADSPAWAADADLPAGQKNRADHRHHAIDAICIGLTDRRRMQQLSRIAKDGGVRATGEALPDPWDDRPIYDTVRDAVKGLRVSHRARRGLYGALHEETRYGPVRDRLSRERIEGVYVVRKPVEQLSAIELSENVRDAGIRQCLLRALHNAGLNVEKKQGQRGRPSYRYVNSDGKKAGPTAVADALRKAKMMPSNVPIRRVRLLRKNEAARPLRPDRGDVFVVPGNTHHVVLYRWTERGREKRGFVAVTMLEAADRARRGQPLVQMSAPPAGSGIPAKARPYMSLCAGETVLATRAATLDVGDGPPELLVFKSAVTTQKRLVFVRQTDARKSTAQDLFQPSPNTFEGVKVLVDPLGRLRHAAAADLKTEITIDPRVQKIAEQRHRSGLSLSKARKRLAEQGLKDRGAELTAALHRLREAEPARRSS